MYNWARPAHKYNIRLLGRAHIGFNFILLGTPHYLRRKRVAVKPMQILHWIIRVDQNSCLQTTWQNSASLHCRPSVQTGVWTVLCEAADSVTSLKSLLNMDPSKKLSTAALQFISSIPFIYFYCYLLVGWGYSISTVLPYFILSDLNFKWLFVMLLPGKALCNYIGIIFI